MDIPDDLIGDVVAPHALEEVMMMPEETGLVSEEPLLPTTDPTAAHPVVGNLKLLTLPIDSLHCIASFVTASDWASVGLTTTIATPICRDVFQRVRMHGFRCATEVVTAWVSSACVQIHSV